MSVDLSRSDSVFLYPSQDETGALDLSGLPSSRTTSATDSRGPVYIIIPCYNRRDTTLQCLARLKELGILSWARVVIVDDASPDQTGTAVEESYPDVAVLYGDGNLWWAGAINKGMEYALKQRAEFLFWLNDDCRPRNADSIRLLVDYAREHQRIAVGQAICPSGYFYGGAFKKMLGRSRHVFCEADKSMACDIFSGNAVCVPRWEVEQLGLLDARHFPMMADADYGLRAKKRGLKAVVVGKALFESEENTSLEDQSLLLSQESIKTLWRAKFYSIKSSTYLPSYFRLCMRHWGVFGLLIVFGMLLKHLLYIPVRLLLPREWLIQRLGNRLRTWRVK